MNANKAKIFNLYRYSDLLIENDLKNNAEKMIKNIDEVVKNPNKENILKLYNYSDLLIENGLEKDAKTLKKEIRDIL